MSVDYAMDGAGSVQVGVVLDPKQSALHELHQGTTSLQVVVYINE
jgi:hypothetical protein